MDDDAKLVKSMEICQGAISRLANNAFSLKAWFLVAFSALFTFFSRSVSGDSSYKVSISDVVWLFPMLVFPVLDAYYLRQERLFRAVYDDFNLKINGINSSRMPFDLKPTPDQTKEFSLANVIFSISVGWLYFPMLSVFQALIIYHADAPFSHLTTLIFPIMIIFAALVFRKKSAHQ